MLPAELRKLKAILEHSLAETATLWTDIHTMYQWVHRAAHILDNAAGESGLQVRRRYQGLLGAMRRWSAQTGTLEPSVQHFLKVTRSYWPGLFHCYLIAGLPRTNNDLEHVFGTHRYHERRTTGRKTGSPALVVRGAARIVAAVATQVRAFSATDLAAVQVTDWLALRGELDKRRHSRVLQRRFRRDPELYLAGLEKLLSS
jgi:hypothetical protein